MEVVSFTHTLAFFLKKKQRQDAVTGNYGHFSECTSLVRLFIKPCMVCYISAFKEHLARDCILQDLQIKPTKPAVKTALLLNFCMFSSYTTSTCSKTSNYTSEVLLFSDHITKAFHIKI